MPWRAISTRRRSSLRRPPPDYLSWSHGEGFFRFFEERCRRQGLYILDEPESALSPSRQIELLKMLKQMDADGYSQVIMATHSPLLMACPTRGCCTSAASGSTRPISATPIISA